MCLILWHRHFPWNSAAVWRKNQEGPSSCVVCSKGKQSSNIPTARSTKEPATSPQVVLEIIYTGLSFQSFLFTIYQVISRNAYYINCCEGKGWEEDKQKISGGKAFLCVCTCVCMLSACWCVHACGSPRLMSGIHCCLSYSLKPALLLKLRAHWCGEPGLPDCLGVICLRLPGLELQAGYHHLYRVWGSELWST